MPIRLQTSQFDMLDGNTLEIIYNLAEIHYWLCIEQGSFRRNRSREYHIQKAGRQPGCISPYRQVSLTSCMAKRWRESTTWRKHVTGYALNNGASAGTDHVNTRSCVSRNRSMADVRPQSPKKTASALLDYSKAFGGMPCLPIAYAQGLRDFPSNRKTKA